MSSTRHFTTRRSFIAALGFGGVGLYGLWAAYGAAPGPLSLFGLNGGHPKDENSGGGHETATDRLSADAFRRLTAEFIARYRMPDGSVYPRNIVSRDMPAMSHGHPAAPVAADTGAGHDAHATSAQGHAIPGAAPATDTHGHADDDLSDVYLLAEKWFFEPAVLRLDAGVPYRFRMMATDVSHGASIQFGRGARMIRLRPNTVAEMTATFDRPGKYLVYCTVYCGQAHDFMQARIDVI